MAEYLVICTFDLSNATRDDYVRAYSELERVGLRKVVVGNSGKQRVMPTTTVAGAFVATAADAAAQQAVNRVVAIFARLGYKAEIFCVAAGDWAWEARST